MDPSIAVAAGHARVAVAHDGAGRGADAADAYVEAAAALLAVIKAERDAQRRAGLGARMETYLSRAEALRARRHAPPPAAAQQRAPAPPAAPPATRAAPRQTPAAQPHDTRARASTTQHYFSTDKSFRADVERARLAVARVEASGVAFTDAQFPPGPGALVGPSPDAKSAAWAAKRCVSSWVRASSLGAGWRLFDDAGPEPRDVDQGEVGDCWLLSSLAVLAHYPELVRRLLVTNAVSGAGAYAVRLCYAGEWRLLLLDDSLPVRGDGAAAFARPRGGVLWVALLEKAVAKLFGSYAALESGTAAEALGLLTGLPTHVLEKVHEAAAKPGGLDGVFGHLARAHRSGFVVSASCGHTSVAEAQFQPLGLLHAHEYSVLRVAQLSSQAGAAPTRLVQLRNPWARGEWRGRWGRGAKEWRGLDAAAKRALDDEGCLERNDGVFWMPLEDFCKFFHEATVCRLRRNFAQARVRVPAAGGLDEVTVAYVIQTPAGGAVSLDACLLQATGRGTVPRGHHVSGDTLLCVFKQGAGASDFVAASDARTALAPVAGVHDVALEPAASYLLLPLVFNWRVLGLEKQALHAVVYSSEALAGDPRAVTLSPQRTAELLRAVVKAKGNAKGTAPAAIFEFDGIHVVENHSESQSLTITITMGKSSNLVSSRHGGVLDATAAAGAYVVRDTLPPKSWQVVSIRSPFRPTWSIENSSLSWVHEQRPEQHAPPLRPGPSIHSVYPLDAP